MRTAKLILLEFVLALVVQAVVAQTTLPAEYTGPWQYGIPPSGWTFTSLGGPDYLPDYDGINDGAAKLDGTGDAITIHYDATAGAVSYWIRGLTFSGGTFSLEESTDGGSWTTVRSYTNPPATATFETLFPSPASRWLRFIYTLKGTGNVGIDGISIVPFVQPVISAFAAGGTSQVTVEETVSGRTYVLESAPVLTAVPVQWTEADSGSGTGGSLLLQDASPTNGARFYRVRDATTP